MERYLKKNLHLVWDSVLSLPYTCIGVFSVWYRAILAHSFEVWNMSALNFDVYICLCLNIILRFTNSWRQSKQVDWPLDPSNLLKVYLYYLLEYCASLFIYLGRLVAVPSSGIKVPPFPQLIQELQLSQKLLNGSSTNEPGDVGRKERELLKIQSWGGNCSKQV